MTYYDKYDILYDRKDVTASARKEICMIAEERRKALIGFLSKNEYTSLHTIFYAFPEISPSTLRRDLQSLTSEGRVILLRGGAKLPDREDMYDLPIDSKLLLNTFAKKRMSFYAASLIHDADVVYLDSSSSVYPIMQFISAKQVTIVTTGIYTVLKAVKLGFRCVTVGGTVKGDVGSVAGSITEEQLRGMHFDISFMSSNGISEEHGISTPHSEEAAKIKIVKKNSTKTFLLMDGSKHGLSFTYRALDLRETDVISDAHCGFEDKCRSFFVADACSSFPGDKEDGTTEGELI